MDEETRWKFLMDHAKITGKEEPEAFKSQVRKLLRIYHAHARAMYSYAAEPYDGRVLYFRAAQPGPYNAKDPEKVWGSLVKGELIIHPVPGDHNTMNDPPHVSRLGELLKDYLAGCSV
jgi:thioesterase domain-containing protein